MSRTRAGSASVVNGGGGDATEVLTNNTNSLSLGERKGVTLEDKPLSRRTSVKRAASAVKKAATQAFAPIEKVDGEKRVLILVADGTEEIEVMTVYDVCVRASLGPTLASVSPLFSPSQSLPVSLALDSVVLCER